MSPVLYFIFGLAAGIAITWLLMRGTSDTGSLTKKLNDTQKEKENLLIEVADKSAKLSASEEKLKLIDEATEKLSDTFKALSAEALKSNNQSFLELARENLGKFQEAAKGDLDKRQQAINELVKPINEVLGKVDTKIQKMDVSFSEQVKSLIDSERNLQRETSYLKNALKSSPNVRGRWGEIQLKRVVEMAGMVDYCDFYQQENVSTEEGRSRPDMRIRLPANKSIYIDAKAPLDAYLAAVEAVDDEKRAAKLKDHADHVGKHIKLLSSKKYWNQLESSPEFVVLFLPGEVFFSAALEADPTLIEAGVDKGVILATPTTLIALLRAVAYGWREEGLAKNAKEISSLGKELYERLLTMGEHMTSLGSSLGKSVKEYNKAVGSLETRVLVSARKFKELKAAPETEEIKVIETIDQSPREIQTPGMTGDNEPSADGNSKES